MYAMHIKIICSVRLEAELTSLARVAGVFAEGERRVPGTESRVELQRNRI